MKKIKITISIVAFLLLLLGFNELFHYLLTDDTRSYTRLMMHEMYNQDENIDVLFLGSSHCYRSLNPAVTDEIWSCNTFNAGSSLQGLDSSYALLVEAHKQYNLQQVYVELYYGVTNEIFHNRTDMTATYLISDYMKPSLNRTRLLLNASTSEYYVNGFILGRRNWEKLFDSNYILDLYARKSTPSYKNYEYIDDISIGDSYMGKGYCASTMSMDNDSNYTEFPPAPISDNYISADCQKYMVKIIEYCEKNDIQLCFFSAPMADFYLDLMGNYDSYISQVKSIVEPYNVEYYDFNLCSNDYLMIDGFDYMEPQHLNINGSFKFSTVFSQFFTGELDDSIFYEDFKTKLQTESDALLGYEIITLSEDSISDEYEDMNFDFENYSYCVLNPLSYQDKNFEFRITDCTENGDVLIQDWNENVVVYYPCDISGYLNIEARLTGTETIVSETKYYYNR